MVGRPITLDRQHESSGLRRVGNGEVNPVPRGSVLWNEPQTFSIQSITNIDLEGVQLGLVRRNLDLAARLAAATDTRSPLIDATLAAWNAAERKLGYGADVSSIIKWLETLPSLKPAPEPESKPAIAGSGPSA